MTMARQVIPFQVLDTDVYSDASVGQGAWYWYYLIQVDNSKKYLRYHPGPAMMPEVEIDRIMDLLHDTDILMFDKVPSGDWNVMDIVWDDEIFKFVPGNVDTRPIDAIVPWYHQFIDIDDLPPIVFPLNMDHMHQILAYPFAIICDPCLGQTRPVHAAYVWSPDNISGMKLMSKNLSIVHGHGIAPPMLAHITINRERVIGYVLETVPNGRPPTMQDFDACRAVLQKLHNLELAFNLSTATSMVDLFTVNNQDGSVYITGLKHAQDMEDPKIFERDMKLLLESLKHVDADRSSLWLELNT